MNISIILSIIFLDFIYFKSICSQIQSHFDLFNVEQKHEAFFAESDDGGQNYTSHISLSDLSPKKSFWWYPM